MKQPKAVNYTVIKHSEHLRILKKCRKHSSAARVSTFPWCSQIPVVFHHSVIHDLGFFICQITHIRVADKTAVRAYDNK